MKNKFILPIIVVVIVVIAGSIFAFNYFPNISSQEKQMEGSMEKSNEVMIEGYGGEVITGSTTPYLRYNEADFEKAKSEGKIIYVYFYATWCPICAAERPNVLGAFDELELENAVGFEAHWRDGQDNEADQNLAREFGVSSQHTHLFINSDGILVEKTLSGLSKEEIKSKLTEIAQVG